MPRRHPDSAPQFTYLWWYQPGMMTVGGALAGLILIGGVWPTVVRLLVGAGLAREPEGPKYDLGRSATNRRRRSR